jgi:hypothetical protein
MLNMVAWAHGWHGQSGVGGALVLVAAILLVVAMLGSMSREYRDQ